MNLCIIYYIYLPHLQAPETRCVRVRVRVRVQKYTCGFFCWRIFPNLTNLPAGEFSLADAIPTRQVLVLSPGWLRLEAVAPWPQFCSSPRFFPAHKKKQKGNKKTNNKTRWTRHDWSQIKSPAASRGKRLLFPNDPVDSQNWHQSVWPVKAL